MKNSITVFSNSPILQENRQDPITGDLIKEGDKVVICAACKSAFLEGSWNYLGQQHCQQKETLSQIPAKQNFKFVKRVEQIIFSAENSLGNTALIVAVPTGIISFIISILLILSITDLLWLWGVVAGLISIPIIFNAFQTKGVEVKETAIYIKKGFGLKRKILISKLNEIDFIYYKNFDYNSNTEQVKANRRDIIESDLIISTAPTIRIKGFIFPLNLALSEYDFNKNREKFIEFFSKISYVLRVNLATNDEQLIKEFKEKVNNAVIKKDLVGLRYVYGKFYKKIYLG